MVISVHFGYQSLIKGYPHETHHELIFRAEYFLLLVKPPPLTSMLGVTCNYAQVWPLYYDEVRLIRSVEIARLPIIRPVAQERSLPSTSTDETSYNQPQVENIEKESTTV